MQRWIYPLASIPPYPHLSPFRRFSLNLELRPGVCFSLTPTLSPPPFLPHSHFVTATLSFTLNSPPTLLPRLVTTAFPSLPYPFSPSSPLASSLTPLALFLFFSLTFSFPFLLLILLPSSFLPSPLLSPSSLLASSSAPSFFSSPSPSPFSFFFFFFSLLPSFPLLSSLLAPHK